MAEVVYAPRLADLTHMEWLKAAQVVRFDGLKTLDLGCGSGFLSAEQVARGASRAVGIDIECPPAAADQRISFLNLNLDDQKWPRSLSDSTGVSNFDLITAFDIIEHLASPWDFLQSCRQLANPKTHLILTTPNILSWERYLRPDSWSGCTDPQHKILFSRYSLRFLLGKSGWNVISMKAPVRKLKWLQKLAPDIGGQIFVMAKLAI